MATRSAAAKFIFKGVEIELLSDFCFLLRARMEDMEPVVKRCAVSETKAAVKKAVAACY